MTTETKRKAPAGFTAEEVAAMKERNREAKAAARRSSGADKTDGLGDLQAKIADMPEPDRSMAQRIHEVVMAAVPEFEPKTYYGMPAYAKDGRTICFFKPASKFKMRYATFGFQPDAKLDDATMWPTEFALLDLSAANEARLTELVRKASS
ncbi:MAG TPA: DUF1801 domain-containing protein [Candidatus Limnocylindrales bacterium]